MNSSSVKSLIFINDLDDHRNESIPICLTTCLDRVKMTFKMILYFPFSVLGKLWNYSNDMDWKCYFPTAAKSKYCI